MNLNLIFVTIVAIVIFFFICTTIKKKLIFVNYMKSHVDFSSLNLVSNDVYIKTEDNETLHGLIVYPKTDKNVKGFIIFSHGNGGDIGFRTHYFNLFSRLGYIVLYYDYRGYGKSTGSPSEKGVNKDIVAVWNYVTNLNIDPKNIIIMGESLGTSVSLYLVSYLRQKGIIHKCTILISPFYSLRHVVSDLLPKFFSFLSLLVYEFPSNKYIEGVNRPILLMHSPSDELVLYKNSKALLNNNNVQLYDLQGGHNSLKLDINVEHKIEQFITSCDI